MSLLPEIIEVQKENLTETEKKGIEKIFIDKQIEYEIENDLKNETSIIIKNNHEPNLFDHQ